MPQPSPTRAQILAKIKEFDRIGQKAFLLKYASGFGARSWYIEHRGALYDMKAIWAAAHNPPRWPGGFNTSEPHLHLPFLGFNRISAAQAKTFREGQKRLAEATFFHRSASLVEEAKKKYGYVCAVCHTDYGKKYGKLGHALIECHHLHEMKMDKVRQSTVDDVRTVCANCHRMLHAGGKLRAISELQKELGTGASGTST